MLPCSPENDLKIYLWPVSQYPPYVGRKEKLVVAANDFHPSSLNMLYAYYIPYADNTSF